MTTKIKALQFWESYCSKSKTLSFSRRGLQLFPKEIKFKRSIERDKERERERERVRKRENEIERERGIEIEREREKERDQKERKR